MKLLLLCSLYLPVLFAITSISAVNKHGGAKHSLKHVKAGKHGGQLSFLRDGDPFEDNATTETLVETNYEYVTHSSVDTLTNHVTKTILETNFDYITRSSTDTLTNFVTKTSVIKPTATPNAEETCSEPIESVPREPASESPEITEPVPSEVIETAPSEEIKQVSPSEETQEAPASETSEAIEPAPSEESQELAESGLPDLLESETGEVFESTNATDQPSMPDESCVASPSEEEEVVETVTVFEKVSSQDQKDPQSALEPSATEEEEAPRPATCPHHGQAVTNPSSVAKIEEGDWDDDFQFDGETFGKEIRDYIEGIVVKYDQAGQKRCYAGGSPCDCNMVIAYGQGSQASQQLVIRLDE